MDRTSDNGSSRVGGHAVVIGAGLAGLASAGVLSHYFERVTVFEIDDVPAGTPHRNGTPQDRHTHGLLVGGIEALEEVFPGFTAEVVQAGGASIVVGRDFRYERPGFDAFPVRDFGWLSYGMSRPSIERIVREQVERRGNVELRGGCRVQEITTAAGGKTVNGVRVEREGRSELHAAQFIVDASGRGNPTVALLRKLGAPQHNEAAVGVDIGYSTAIFELPNDASREWQAVLCFPQAPHSTRCGIIMPVEGNRWMVSLLGRFDDKPPRDPGDFLAYARGLRTQTIADAIAGAKRLTPVLRFAQRTCYRRDFASCEDFPTGLVPLGDAVCRFNPMYGQGMSVAAQQARLLGRLLEAAGANGAHVGSVTPKFLAGVQALLETPWSMTTVLDFGYPQTEGERPPDINRRRGFSIALLRLAAADPAIHRLTLGVQHLLLPESALREPSILERVRGLIAQEHSMAS